MPKFNKLKDYQLKLDGVPYVIDELEDKPTIWFRPGTNDNKAFLNESLRRSNNRPPRTATTAESIDAAIQEDREVIASTCALKWDVKDDDGEDVPFSAENCLEYFEALPNWIFDRIRQWVTRPANFIPAHALGEGSPRA